jgi:hypothetical protein
VPTYEKFYLLKVYTSRLVLDQVAHMIDKIVVPRVFLVKFLWHSEVDKENYTCTEQHSQGKHLTFSDDIWITVLYISAMRACSTALIGFFEEFAPPKDERLREFAFFGKV